MLSPKQHEGKGDIPYLGYFGECRGEQLTFFTRGACASGSALSGKPRGMRVSGKPQTEGGGWDKDTQVVCGMDASQCGNDRPRFGLPAVTQKLSAYNIIRVLNIIKLKLNNII
jgi:hypothetical protein